MKKREVKLELNSEASIKAELAIQRSRQLIELYGNLVQLEEFSQAKLHQIEVRASQLAKTCEAINRFGQAVQEALEHYDELSRSMTTTQKLKKLLKFGEKLRS